MLQPCYVLLDVIVILNVTYLSKCVNVFICHPTVSLKASFVRSLEDILSVVVHVLSVGPYPLGGLAALKKAYSPEDSTSFRLKSACLHLEEELASLDVRAVVLTLFYVEKEGVEHLKFLKWGRNGFYDSR